MQEHNENENTPAQVGATAVTDAIEAPGALRASGGTPEGVSNPHLADPLVRTKTVAEIDKLRAEVEELKNRYTPSTILRRILIPGSTAGALFIAVYLVWHKAILEGEQRSTMEAAAEVRDLKNVIAKAKFDLAKAAHQSQLESIKARISASEYQNQEKSRQLEKTQSEHKAVQQKYEVAAKELNNARNQVKLLSSDRIDSEEIKRENIELNEKIAALEASIVKLDEERRSARMEHDAALARAQDAEDKIEGLRKDLDSAKAPGNLERRRLILTENHPEVIGRGVSILLEDVNMFSKAAELRITKAPEGESQRINYLKSGEVAIAQFPDVRFMINYLEYRKKAKNVVLDLVILREPE